MDLKVGDVLISKETGVVHTISYVSELSVMLVWTLLNRKCEGSYSLTNIPTIFEKIEPNRVIWLNTYNWGVEIYYSKEEADKQLNKEECLSQQVVILNVPYDEKVLKP
jgi:hypothetical protein